MWLKASAHDRGIIFVLLASICWSSGGVFFRAMAVDTWIISFYRSLFAAGFLFIISALYQKNAPLATRDSVSNGIGVALSVAVSMATFLPALALTSVASVAFIYAASPILAAILGAFLLSEPIDRVGIVCAIVVAFGAAVLMASSEAKSDLFGNFLALVSAIAAVIVGLSARARQSLFLPYIGLGNVLVAAISFVLAPTLSIGVMDAVSLSIFAFIQVALSFVLFVSGARLLAVRETALIKAIEGPLSPLWVWLAFNEQPGLLTLTSGAIILMAVIAHILLAKGHEGQPL